MEEVRDIVLPRNVAGMHTFTWTILNFTKLTENLSSPHFRTEAENFTMRWFATLKFSSKGVDVWLTRDFDGTEEVKVQLTTIILDSYGLEKDTASSNLVYTEKNSSQCCCLLRFLTLPSDIPVAEALGNILSFPDSLMTVHFNMSISTHLSDATFDDLLMLSDSFHSMYDSGNGTDIILRVGQDSIRAHKVVLSCRSPVFAERMRGMVYDGNDSVLEITDISVGILRALVIHLYTGNVKHFGNSLDEELYDAAVKYSVESLQKSCTDLAINKLSSENACCVLRLAAKRKDTRLLSATTGFICDNFAELGKTSKWNTLITDDPRLCSQVFVTYFSRIGEY